MAQRSFLLIGNDEGLAAHLMPSLQAYGVVRRARSIGELLGAEPRTVWAGVVVDLDGLLAEPPDALEELRERAPQVPVLGISSRARPELVNRMHALRAELVLKPVSTDNLVSFARRGLAHAFVPDIRVAAGVDALASGRALTARETQLVAYALGNETREQLTRRLGITRNTLKTQVRALLRKCGASSLDALATSLLRDVLVFEVVGADGRLEEPGAADNRLTA